VSVFLRWGVFGILGVAALLYAYNASKKLAQAHAAKAPVAAQSAGSADAPAVAPARVVMREPGYDGLAPPCRLELEVAYMAVVARDSGDPLDRLLRVQKIAWQDDAKVRERLTQVATRWFQHAGEVDPDRLRDAVNLECLNAQAPAVKPG
jgi:hypothetical protein